MTHNPRAVEGLFAGLHDDEFNVRYSCARALARMNERDEHMAIAASDVLKAPEREASVDRAVWVARDIGLDPVLPAIMASVQIATDRRIDYSIEHVFTLLSLTLDSDALALSRHAVLSADRNLRGTALEYLENVLPENVRRGLWPHFREIASVRSTQRIDVVADLKRTIEPK